jgi:signal peptidase I
MSFFAWKRNESSPTPEAVKGSSALGFFFELVQVVAISLAIIIPVRYFLIQPFYVKGLSMEPSFFDHEYLIIDELSYRFRTPERGEIVVFRYPADPSQFFIKRVIGLPGETVEVTDTEVKVYNNDHPNGMVLNEESYLPDEYLLGEKKVLTLRADEYFVMGDNRTSSLDSRFFGAVKSSAIVGRVWLRGWPVDRWKVFETPLYDL